MSDASDARALVKDVVQPQTRLMVFDWPAQPQAGLREALAQVASFARAAEPPRVLGLRARQLHWKGELAGGAVTLLEHLGAVLAESGLDALLADPRIEFFASACGQVTLLSEAASVTLGREEFVEHLAALDRELDRVPAMGWSAPDADEILGCTDRLAAVAGVHRSRQLLMAGRSADELDFDLLDGADATLVERYDSEGLLEESWVACQTRSWRTDFLAPGTCRVPGEAFDDSLCWRVAQWEWSETGDGESSWRLRAHATLSAEVVAEILTASLRRWVLRATEEGIELCSSLIEGGERHFAIAQQRLRDELDVLRQ